jgi:hypothetical protein
MLPLSLFLAMCSACPAVVRELFPVVHHPERWWRSSVFRNQRLVGDSPMPPPNQGMNIVPLDSSRVKEVLRLDDIHEHPKRGSSS